MGMPLQNEGYFIVLKPEYVIERFEKREKVQKHFDEYQQFRKVYTSINPRNYRGISREVFEPFICFDKPNLRWYQEHDITDCGLARLRMGEIQKGLDNVQWAYFVTEKMLKSLEDVRDILSYIEDTSFFEVIFIRRDIFNFNANTLGFDIGYVEDDQFSIIADLAVTPQWHPSDPADDTEILEYFENLNENVLFKDVSSAERFLNYYRTRPWAETEEPSGQFYPIQVDKVSL
ncbi:MAG: hypothetical protein LLF76_00075 [Planctomycetaceae bacterium]|nr:hypothetical protein [Planctomycetaceae bacterium]